MDQITIDEVVRQLRTALWPIAIYRFGDNPNEPDAGSRRDINLCVIVPDDQESTYHKSLKAYSSLRDLPFPKNIVVRHQSDFRKRSQWLDSLEWEITTTGCLIYGQTESGNRPRPVPREKELASDSRQFC